MMSYIQCIDDALRARLHPQPASVIDQYMHALKRILRAFRAAGIDTSETERKLAEGLLDRQQDKKFKAGFVGYACELAAAAHFQLVCPNAFRHHVPHEYSPKNFDFSFSVRDFNFNVEVKSFAKDVPNREALPVKLFRSKREMECLYAQGLRFARNRMPAVSRALNDANSQLRRPDRGFAVALLCCNDMDEYADVMECLAGRNGIILGKEAENQIIARLEDLTNIDAVVVCLLGLGHRAMEDASHCRNVFRNVDIDLADGAEPWEYRASMPVGLILRAAEQSPDLQQEFQSAFRSHHVCLAELLDNGRELQEAIFEYYQSMLDANSTVGIAAKEVEAIQVLPEGSA